MYLNDRFTWPCLRTNILVLSEGEKKEEKEEKETMKKERISRLRL